MNADRNHVFGFICVYRRSSAAHNPFSQRLSGRPLPDALGDPIGNQQKWLVAEHLLIAVLRAGTGDLHDGEGFACAFRLGEGAREANAVGLGVRVADGFGNIGEARLGFLGTLERWGRGDASSEPIQSPANGASPAAATSAQAARVSSSDFINTSGVRGQG